MYAHSIAASEFQGERRPEKAGDVSVILTVVVRLGIVGHGEREETRPSAGDPESEGIPQGCILHVCTYGIVVSPA